MLPSLETKQEKQQQSLGSSPLGNTYPSLSPPNPPPFTLPRVGSLGVQLAKKMGASLVRSCAAPDHLAYVTDLGADVVIDFTQADVFDGVPDDSVDVEGILLGVQEAGRCFTTLPKLALQRWDDSDIQGSDRVRGLAHWYATSYHATFPEAMYEEWEVAEVRLEDETDDRRPETDR